MTQDFNIRDREWNLSYSHHSASSDILLEVTDSFDLKLLWSVNQIPIQYTDNPNDANSVINFMFLQADLNEINNHLILPKSRSRSDHAPLTVYISIDKEFIQEKIQTII